MEKNKTERRRSFGGGIGEAIRRGAAKRKGDRLSLVYDVLIVATAFLFARSHALFGAYPLAIAFIGALPSGVWLALVGAVTGSLSLGGGGIISAVICLVVVLLRIIISGGEGRGGAIFSESLLFRAASSTIGSFIGAIYEVLLSGLRIESVLYGCASVLLTALFTFLLSGVFYTGITVSDILTSRVNIFGKGTRRDVGLILFQGSALVYIILISYSLKGYNLFGISSGYVFSAVLTLIAARRFGAVRGAVVGFASSLAISGTYSVAFMLVGAASGLLYSLGIGYAVIGGGIVLSAWSAYVGGALGFLTTFPEYSLSAMLVLPILKRLAPDSADDTASETCNSTAEDMVNALALSYRKSIDSADSLSEALRSAARVLHRVGADEGALTLSEYRDTVIKCEAAFCPSCPSYPICVGETPAPCIEFADVLAMKLYKKERLFPNDPSAVPRYCHASEELFSAITRAAADREREREKNRRITALAEEYELISRLITEAHLNDARESSRNAAFTERVSELISHSGLKSPAVRVLGESRPHFIIAGGDRDGSIVTSPELHRGIEDASGVLIGDFEYFRRGDIAVLECSARERYTVDFFAVGRKKRGEDASGDAVTSMTEDGRFLALLSDGMGSGEEAHTTAELTSELLSELLCHGARRQTALHVVNHLMKSRAVECSATVDLFDFDLITGEAVFYKSGAAPSYVKRGGSIFRIKSETAPIGILSSIDAERIRIEVEAGDTVVMLSDGIAGGIEDGAWLLELLARPTSSGVREYAEEIIAEAERRAPITDDATVAVMRISKREPEIPKFKE